MPRNLERRVELLVPVEEQHERDRLLEVLDTSLADTEKGRELLADGGYRPVEVEAEKIGIRSQWELCERARNRAVRAERARTTVLSPHRPSSE